MKHLFSQHRLAPCRLAPCLLAPCLLALCLFAPNWSGTAWGQDRPNILWVTSEDNSHHWLGCYGNELARTPNLDRLADEGVRYRHAYANTAVCAVARFTLITGRYACGMGTQNMRSRYPIPERFGTYVAPLREAGYYCVNRSKTDYNFATDDRRHWDECNGRAHWKNRGEGQPFFAVFNTTISHESSLFPSKTANYRQRGLIPETPRLDPSQAQLPPYLPDTPEIREDWVTYTDVITAMDQQVGEWLDELDEAGLREDTIVIYYADHGGILPRAKRYIYDTGTHVPMIVHLPEKWAHLAADAPGSTSDRLVSFIDLPPTALSLAGIEVPARMQGRAFLGEGRRAAEPYIFLYGQRFDARMLRFVRAMADGRYRYIRNFAPHRHRGILAGYPHGQAGWRAFDALRQAGKLTPEQASFWKTPQPAEEFYDLEQDPWEVNNLADDPAYAEQRNAMRQALLEKMREIRDTGLVPEAMYDKLSNEGTVYDYVQDESFPYEQVLQLALTATEGDPQALPDLRAALQADHPVIRYWGAVGCTILGDDAQPLAGELQESLRDSASVVRIAAAEALVHQGAVAAGRDALIAVLAETEDDMVALLALNVTAALGLTGDIPAGIYEKACATGSYPKRMLEDYPG